MWFYMMNNIIKLIDRLENNHTLELSEYEYLIENYSKEAQNYISQRAVTTRKNIYGNDIYVRGLIEISNICKNNCFYCGIRRDNNNCSRYRLTDEDILSCVHQGYNLGFRTFVLQGGEDAYFTDEVLLPILTEIKNKYPDTAITLSLGERSKESYKKLFDAGADRYLLRHETADKEHYKMLHPSRMSFDNRIECLKNLKEIGYQVGCGFMVGSPYQNAKTISKDLKFIEEFEPEMCGIGPFIANKDTPFSDKSSGTLDMTLYLLSILRLIKPNLLLPATTALGTIHSNGRELGILAGANVIMPNLSPISVRKKYELYENKIYTGDESATNIERLKQSMELIGYTVVTDKGDPK